MDEVIGVGGVIIEEDGSVRSSLWYLQGPMVEVCADAAGINGNGASYAAARAAGIAAAWMDSGVPADGIRGCFRDNAEDLGDKGWDPVYGWGLIRNLTKSRKSPCFNCEKQ